MTLVRVSRVTGRSSSFSCAYRWVHHIEERLSPGIMSATSESAVCLDTPHAGVLSSEAGEDLTCSVCGSSLLPMIEVAGNSDGLESHTGDRNDHVDEVNQAVPVEPGSASRAAKPSRSTKSLRPKPSIVHSKAVRCAVRVEMLACIPGFNRARARALMGASQDGTFAGVASLSPHTLARILAEAEPGLAKDPELKVGLVKALKRVLQ